MDGILLLLFGVVSTRLCGSTSHWLECINLQLRAKLFSRFVQLFLCTFCTSRSYYTGLYNLWTFCTGCQLDGFHVPSSRNEYSITSFARLTGIRVLVFTLVRYEVSKRNDDTIQHSNRNNFDRYSIDMGIWRSVNCYCITVVVHTTTSEDKPGTVDPPCVLLYATAIFMSPSG